MTTPQSAIPNPQSAIARPVVSIGSKRIGSNNPVYIIAEAGVNHDGDRVAARRLIDAAHEVGADAIKFQVFSADRLVAGSAPACDYQKVHDDGVATQHAMLRRLELPAPAFRELNAHAGRLGIGFLATPFGLPELDFLAADLKVPAIKIASSDLVNVPLIAAAAETNLPLIVSVGAGRLDEIDEAVRLVRSRKHPDSQSEKTSRRGAEIAEKEELRLCCRKPSQISAPLRLCVNSSQSAIGPRLILLHCVSAYPTRPADARLACIRTLALRYGVPVGFSDHTPDPTFSALAVAAGAVILEKHLTLDRTALGPDHFFSLQPEQFGQYVTAARDAQAALGDGTVLVAPEESEVRKLARGSIVTTRPVGAGETLTADHLAVQRPGDGIDPARWNDILGRVATTDIPPKTRLSWPMLA